MIQHQFWVTKKTVLKKLGTKEDECVVSSDAELDAKLELFRSINESCISLQRILDQYQDRLCALSQEENSLGKFLRDKGKNDDAAGKHLLAAGKAINYSGQQRLSMRGSLMRLFHEVETFRSRAVSDMRLTVSDMEKARTEYRAALSWMKSTSAQLDPDTGRGLDNFRRAQRQVRESKKVFDKLKLDVLQKIDLLAAARCNMFSHALVSYQNTFFTSSCKIAETLNATHKSMLTSPQYQFKILKELSQNVESEQAVEAKEEVLDKDQMLFFKDDYKDEDIKETKEKVTEVEKEEVNDKPTLPENEGSSQNLIDPLFDDFNTLNNQSKLSNDLAGLNLYAGSNNAGYFLPSQLLSQEPLLKDNNTTKPTTSGNLVSETKKPPSPYKKHDPNNKADWFSLFAELDPLGNPDTLLGNTNSQGHQA